MIPPDAFISLAEQTGLIHELTRQIYQYALANLPESVHQAKLKLALNLSPINLNDGTFPRWLLDKCQEHGVAPSQIILEVTETASLNNPLALLENLTQFRIRGFHLSIDDFGVGYSSLVQLARLPFSELKIDQMFVKTLADSEDSRKIVTAVVGLGNSLGLNVVAEGVEDAWALEFLHKLGCDEAQGYFIARPMDSLAAAAWSGCSWRSGA
jgi:EAL domain-containing protein (putative c-di-GMP-specific phosphodiesterase class I)